MAVISHLEIAFSVWLAQNLDIPEPVTEYAFMPPHAPRRWRFDFAWPEQKVAVEIEGLLFKGGRHQRIKGFLADAEKYEAALLQGWTVYRVPGPWVMQGQRYIWREQVMDTLRVLLNV